VLVQILESMYRFGLGSVAGGIYDHFFSVFISGRDMFEYRMFKAKARTFEAKATTFCPRAVLKVEDSPQGPHP